MKNTIYTAAAFVIAIAVVATTRFVVPAFVLVFKAIEESYAPKQDAGQVKLNDAIQASQKLVELLNEEDAARAAELATDINADEVVEAEASTAGTDTIAEEKPAPKPRRRRARKAPVIA